MTTNEQTVTGERADILDFLGKHRYFLRHTAEGLTGEQANTRSTVSALTVGGLIKHVTAVERSWAEFAQVGGGKEEVAGETEYTPEMIAEWENQFRLAEGETLAGVLAEYEKVAAATDDLVRTARPRHQPRAPGRAVAAAGRLLDGRRVFLHITAETAQHAGHADIIRETIDGQKTMG